MKHRYTILILCMVSWSVQAATIKYTVNILGDSTYEISHIITLDTFGCALREFTIFVDFLFHKDLAYRQLLQQMRDAGAAS